MKRERTERKNSEHCPPNCVEVAKSSNWEVKHKPKRICSNTGQKGTKFPSIESRLRTKLPTEETAGRV